eukprot:TRINITY_DN2372_c0_g2_i1.p1 TRINITY_DN2372_c0_g2~~TRINITY_DN2372_c0_g2_i1.p1  ORF type:complete len:767 (+),score=172.32 TRINITY_DN2372_c0_g2_i1:19-2319(+)
MDDLIQRSRQSSEDLQADSICENLLNLSQLANNSKDLLYETTEGINGISTNRGYRLLYQLDVDVGTTSELLDEVKISFAPVTKEVGLKSAGSLQTKLEKGQQETFMNLVELAQKTALDSFQASQASFIDSHWNSLKVEIMEGISSHTGIISSDTRIRRSPENEPFKRTVIDTFSPIGGSTHEARVKSVLERWTPDLTGQTATAWDLLQYMLPHTNTTIAERTNGAIKHLENQYKTIMMDMVRRHREYTKRGSNFEPIVFVQAYVRCILMNSTNEWPMGYHEIQDGHPFWPQLFFLLRIGEYDTALKFANRNRNENIVLFSKALTEWVHSRNVTNSLRIEAQRYFNALVANQSLASAANSQANIDVYELVCYGIVSGANLDEVNIETLDRIEDWVWYRLCTGDNLEMLRETLLNAGPEHFGTNYLLYFALLLLVQGFAPAIAFLKEHSIEDAVHFGIFLNYRNALKISTSLDAPIINDSKTVLNLAKLVQNYCSTFAMTDPKRAAIYLLLLEAESLVTPCITSLIINCKEFGLFLGKSVLLGGENSIQQQPFLRSLMPFKQFKTLCESVAKWCETAGHLVQAISLYDIADHTEHSIDILIKHISLLMLSTSENKEEIKSMGETILNHIRRSPSHAKYHQESQLLHIMLKLMDYFKLINKRDFDHALNIIIDLDILPLKVNDPVELYVNKLSKSAALLQQRIGDVLLGMVSILLELYAINKDLRYKTDFIESLRIMGRKTIQFSSRIDIGLRPEVTAALMQLEVFFSH